MIIDVTWILIYMAIGILHCFGVSYENVDNQVSNWQKHESKLIHYLLKHKQYNPLIRPVANLSKTIKVDMGLALIQIISVEERSQIMKTNVWLRMKWMDHQLRWEPSDFGNVKVARISPKRVWQPDIVLFNNADGNYEVSWNPNVLVDSNGEVMWIPPAIFISSCTIRVEYFPFDQQSCEMKFGSWTFDASQLTLGYYSDKKHVDLTDYWLSGSWTLVDCPAYIQNSTSSSRISPNAVPSNSFQSSSSQSSNPQIEESPETHIVYTIIIRRKTLFFTINLIIPCVLISLLTVCVFYLPADAGEKMTLSISILLSLVVFLLLISKILPPTSSSIPLISKFLLFTFIMNIFTITITVMIINWNFRSPNTHRMPKIIRKLFIEILPKYLLMERPEKYMMHHKYNFDKNKLNKNRNITKFQNHSYAHSSNMAMSHNKNNKKSRDWHLKFHNNNHSNIDFIAHNKSADLYSPSFLRKSSYQSLVDEFDNSKQFDNTSHLNYTNVTPCLSIGKKETQTTLIQPPPIISPSQSSSVKVNNENDVSEDVERINCYHEDNLSAVGSYTNRRNMLPSSCNCSELPINREIGPDVNDADECDNQDDGPWMKPENSNKTTTQKNSGNGKIVQISERMRRAIKAINFISNHLEVEDKNKKIMQEWKYVAAVFDRIQLLIFSIVTVSGTIGILLKAVSFAVEKSEIDVKNMYSEAKSLNPNNNNA